MTTPFRTFEPGVLLGDWKSGDDIPDRFYDLVSDGPFRDSDSQTRRQDIRSIHGDVQVAFYREEPLRFPGRYLWVVSRSHFDDGFLHDWIYRSRQRAVEQWARTLATNPPLFGCTEIGCGCGG